MSIDVVALSCSKDFNKLRFEVPPSDDFQLSWIDNCIKEKRKQGNIGLVKPTIPKPAIKPPMPTIPAEAKVEVADIKVEKDDKSNTNQLLLLGLGAIIIILLIKK